MDVVYGGFPYKGKRAATPHSGAHIEFDNHANQWPKGGTQAKDYPSIYAVADGIIDRITASFAVKNSEGTNDRYGINLAIAQDGTNAWSLEYSIEPLVPEPSPGFYKPFMLVKEGDQVKKGQVIGYMYLPPGEGGGSHIHFELITTTAATMKAPAIFTPEVVNAFHAHWGSWGKDGTTAMSACMGWKLNAEENPYAAERVDTL